MSDFTILFMVGVAGVLTAIAVFYRFCLGDASLFAAEKTTHRLLGLVAVLIALVLFLIGGGLVLVGMFGSYGGR